MLARYFRAAAVVTMAVAATLMSAVLMPQDAHAQIPCYYEDPLFPGSFIYYSECGEAGAAVTAIGDSLGALGDQMVNTQLNVGGFAGFITPTGRLRHTNHDGFVDEATKQRGPAFEIDEASFYGNGSYDMPGTYFGGKVRISGLLGYNTLTQDNDAKTFKNEIDAFIYGGSYLWSSGKFYSMSVLIGVTGENEGQNGGGTYSYDLSGYFSNSVIGYTFDLSGPVKFDLRGNIGHYDIDGDRFVIPGTTDTMKGSAEGWNAGIKGTVFTIIDMNGGVARPYLAFAYKNVFDEDIELTGTFTGKLDQDDNYGLAEAGYDFVQGPWTYGAAIYTEFSGDQDTVGGRVGLSLKLQ